MTSYFNLIYSFLFLPLTLLTYALAPKNYKYIILLLASLLFFFLICNKAIIFLFLSIVSIYFSAIKLNKLDIEVKQLSKKESNKLKKTKLKKRIILFFVIIFNLAILLFFKYIANIKIKTLLLPIGISFYTLQAIGYIIDVYNEKIKPEKNFLKLSLFLSFFPQIIAGPIVRFKDASKYLFKGHKITYENICFGYQRIMLGLFKKIVIVDRLYIIVSNVFSNYNSYSSFTLWIALISFSIMIYLSFSGTMDIIMGTGEIFDIRLPKNLKQPFFAKNISEFFGRWNITVSEWFKEYVYKTALSSKFLYRFNNDNVRKLVSLFILCILYGLWYGSSWNYFFLGLYYFFMIGLGILLTPVIVKTCKKLNINRSNILYRILQSIKMSLIVIVGGVFFIAPSIKSLFETFKSILFNFNIQNNKLLSVGLDVQDCYVLIIGLIVIFVISLLKEKNINIREKISEKPLLIRWMLYYILIMSIIIFGAYGKGYVEIDSITNILEVIK